MRNVRLGFEDLASHALPVWILVLTAITVICKLLDLTPRLTLEMMGAWLLVGSIYRFAAARSMERSR